MGRMEPSNVAPSNQNRRAERARRAKDTMNKAIPDILRASPRARHGIHRAELVVDPPAMTRSSQTTPTALPQNAPKIRLQCTDTLAAASAISERPFGTKRTVPTLKDNQARPNVTILNMASPLKAGGGFLDGANSQEEFLCARTTLYPSLWDHFYRLPEVGGVFTPDVMVFRDSTLEANELAKRDRFFIDVISAGMLRFPDVTRGRTEDRAEGGACSCGVSYCDRDRELVTRKMKGVMRLAESKGAERLVLGAWGCGAYGNPVKEVAKIWRKVIAGSPRQRRPNSERWDGIKEIIFAIPDRAMLREFQQAFSDIISYDTPSPCPEDENPRTSETVEPTASSTNPDADLAELISKIAEVEMQMEQTTNSRTKGRLRDILSALNRDLAQGLAAKQAGQPDDLDDLTLSADERASHDDEEEVDADGYVVGGFPASDGEENSFYNFDENDVASDSSDCTASEVYEFRPRLARLQTNTQAYAGGESGDNAAAAGSGAYDINSPSAAFDHQTGWYNGSIDACHQFLQRTGQLRVEGLEMSPASPIMQRRTGGESAF